MSDVEPPVTMLLPPLTTMLLPSLTTFLNPTQNPNVSQGCLFLIQPCLTFDPALPHVLYILCGLEECLLVACAMHPLMNLKTPPNGTVLYIQIMSFRGVLSCCLCHTPPEDSDDSSKRYLLYYIFYAVWRSA